MASFIGPRPVPVDTAGAAIEPQEFVGQADVPAFASVRDIPGTVDLAVIAVPAGVVPGVVDECGEKGVRGLVVVSAGFWEIGPEGAAREREVMRCVRRWGMRLVGPNCLGVLNTVLPSCRSPGR